MSSARYHIRWGNGFEKQKLRDQARPVIRCASELSSVGLRFLGIESPPSPLKVGAVFSKKSFSRYGYASGEKTMQLNLTPSSLSMHRSSIYCIAATVLHETVHCRRMEAADLDSLLEFSTTEGLACSAEYFFNREFKPARKSPTVVDRVLAIPKPKIDELREVFFDTATDPDSFTDELFLKWIGGGNKISVDNPTVRQFSVGEIVGITSVMGHIADGREINEMLTQPVSDILGID